MTGSPLEPGAYGAQLLDHVPEIAKIADIEPRIVCNLDSSDMGPAQWSALAGIVAVAVLVVVAFTLSEGQPDVSPTAGLGPGTTTGALPETTTEEAGTAPPPANRASVALVLVASRGDCWVTVRRGAPNGDIVFSGTIYQGETQRFTGRRLWLEFGDAPSENLNVRLNGQRLRDFPAGEPVVIVTPEGVRAQD